MGPCAGGCRESTLVDVPAAEAATPVRLRNVAKSPTEAPPPIYPRTTPAAAEVHLVAK